jgi:hypothetical protein
MSARIMFIVTTLAMYSLVQAAEKSETQGFGQKPLKGDYLIYGGQLGGTVPPTQKDRKVAFAFKAPLARDLFNYIGRTRKMLARPRRITAYGTGATLPASRTSAKGTPAIRT